MAQEVILAEQTFEFENGGSGAQFSETNSPTFDVGATYKVVWDGVEYTCIASEQNFGQQAICIGNLALAIDGSEDTGEPFILAYIPEVLALEIMSNDSATTHTVAIYTAEEGTEDEETYNANDAIILSYSQNPDLYEKIPKVWLTHPSSTEENPVLVPFTHGEAVNKTVEELDFSEGDMSVPIADGELVTELTLVKPDTLLPENIRKGKEVAGVKGDFIGDTEELTVDLDFANGNQVVTPSAEGKAISQVTIKKPEALIPENIAEGVTIAGIGPGTHSGVGDESSNSTELNFDLLYLKTVTKASAPTTSTVFTIADGMFSKCTSLEEINFPACNSIGSSAFLGCSALKSANFPSCISVNDGAFSGCTNLEEISFPLCVSIGSYAFANCSKISTELSFSKCTYVGAYAFRSCWGVPSLSFPLCVSVGTYAFAYCSSLTGEVYFPECTSLGTNAFRNTNIIQASFPYAIQVSDNAFFSCSQLVSASFPKASLIGQNTFQNCYQLQSVYAPSCKTVWYNAFRNCYSLTYASFKSCTAVYSSAFQSCYSMSYASFPQATNVMSYAFANCTAMVSAYFPKLTGTGRYAFASANLGGVLNFASLTSAYDYAFYNVLGWTAISSGVFPKMTTLWSRAFQFNNNLSYLYLPAAKSLYSYAVANCPQLQTVSLPACVTIGYSTFQGCTKLMSLYLLGSTVVSLYTSAAFLNTPLVNSLLTGAFGSVFVKESLLSTYQTTGTWSTYFSNRLVGLTDDEIAALTPL